MVYLVYMQSHLDFVIFQKEHGAYSEHAIREQGVPCRGLTFMQTTKDRL